MTGVETGFSDFGRGEEELKKSTSCMLQINTAVLLFGFSGVLGKDIALPAVLITLGRVVFSSIALFLFLKTRNTSIHIGSRKDGIVFLAMGALLAVHWTAFIYAIQLSSVAIGVITAATFPLFAAFLEPIFFSERLTPLNILVSLIMIGGVAVLVPMDALGGNVAMGVAYGMFANLAYTVLSLVNRWFAKRYNGVVISFYEQGIAAIVLLPVLLVIPFSCTVQTIGELAVYGIICTAISHSLFINGLQGVTVQTASILDGLETVYGILFAFLLLGAVPTGREILGGIIIVATAVVSSVYKARQNP